VRRRCRTANTVVDKRFAHSGMSSKNGSRVTDLVFLRAIGFQPNNVRIQVANIHDSSRLCESSRLTYGSGVGFVRSGRSK
jgi:hypothetical protein